MAPKIRSLEERFWDKVSVTKGCWEWQGSKHKFGHGQITETIEGKYYNRLAHRVSWKVHFGEWPERQLNHHCDNPSCVNPDHLYEGSQLENMRDRKERNRNPAALKTHCKYGHNDWTIKKSGHRRCAECHRIRARGEWPPDLR